MNFKCLIPRTSDKFFSSHLDGWNWWCVSSDDLQNISSLHIPWKYFIWIKWTSEDNIFWLIDFQACKLTLHIRFKFPELFVFDNIICVDTTIETWWKQCVFVWELYISDCGFVLLESSQTITTNFIPNFNLTVICSCSNQFMIVKTYWLCLMDEPFLVENVTLWFPLPYDNLSKGFQTETDPWSGSINGEGTDLILTNRKCLYFGQFLLE